MTRFGIALDTALFLMKEKALPRADVALVAPSLLRSDLLAHLFRQVADGQFDRAEAKARLDHMRRLKIRLLGDRVLQAVAWDIAEQLDWPDTRQAEYIAVTKLQADAFVTLDAKLAEAAGAFVPVAEIGDLGAGKA